MPEKYTSDYLNHAAIKILSMQHNMPSGVIHDADTVLADIFDNMEKEVTGTGFELIELYMRSTDKPGFCRLFEAITGTTWTQFIDESLRVMTADTEPEEPAMGEWLDAECEMLYVPDKHFTTYHTSQTCSACGMRIKFVGEVPFLNDDYCPMCGKPMKKAPFIFNHHPGNSMEFNGSSHAPGFYRPGDLSVESAPYEPKNINELKPKNNFKIPGDLE